MKRQRLQDSWLDLNEVSYSVGVVAIEPNYTQIAEDVRSDLELLDPFSLSQLFETVLKINQIFPSGDNKDHEPYKGFEDLKEKRAHLVEISIPNLFREMATDFCEAL